MSGYKYDSAFADDIYAFLSFKEAMGVKGKSREWHLWKFDQYCADNGLVRFDRETVEGWVKHRLEEHPSIHLTWMSYIRDFGRYRRARGYKDAYVLSGEFKAKLVRITPYLLSSPEIDAFFDAASRLRMKSPWEWEAKCFFGLMHSCGLRTCEARRLSVDNVDFSNGSIDILCSKGNRSRRLAITDEVAAMIAECDSVTTNIFGASRKTFFVTATGNPVSPCSVGVAFDRIWDIAGLPKQKDGKRPRPYDLRHHFAYANIERWASKGKDVGAMLPYLAKYMGHATFGSTYYYVHTSPDFMAGYTDMVRNCESLIPEVGFDA